MPTATPFAALGAGNGFPSCLGKRDVSGYDYWTTYSGVNKDNPVASDALKSESLVLGMKLFWNLFTLDCSVEASIIGPSTNTSTTISGLSLVETPIERVCLSQTSIIDSDVDAPTASGIIIVNRLPVRMYNGSTNDEDNFVGIGSNADLEARGRADSTTDAIVRLSGRVISADTGPEYDYAYVTVGGISFVCEAIAESSFSGTKTPDAAALTSLVETTSGIAPNETTYTAEATINGLDFYTF